MLRPAGSRRTLYIRSLAEVISDVSGGPGCGGADGGRPAAGGQRKEVPLFYRKPGERSFVVLRGEVTAIVVPVGRDGQTKTEARTGVHPGSVHSPPPTSR